jgi:hypothetical protein
MTKEEQPSLLNKIENIDRRVIYLIVLLAVIFPLIRPIGVPLNISKETVDYYDAITALPDGAKVLCKIDIEAGLIGEIGPAGVATLNQLWEKPVKMVFVFFYRGDGPINFKEVLLPQIKGYVDTTHIGNKVYGVDWVSLGYIEGHEAAMAKLAADMHFVSLDQFGNTLASLPLMNDIKTAGDFNLQIQIGGTDFVQALNQFSTPYKLKTIVATPGTSYVSLLAYYKSGVYSGIINSLSGTAQYENLLRKPGLATVASDALSMTHVALLILIIIANILYIYRRRVKGTRRGGEIK